MRTLSLSVLALASVLLFSCKNGEEQEGGTQAPATIILTPSSLSAEAAGGSYSLTVSAPSRPRIGNLPEWIRLTEGTFKDFTITYGLTLAANTSEQARSASLPVSAGTLSTAFSVSQQGVQKPVTPEPGVDPAGWENAASAARNMGVGWNLGNTLESNSGDVNNMWIEMYTDCAPSDYETAWGQPVATRELIHMFKEAGFKSIRVPVTWYPHMGNVVITGGKWNMASWTGTAVDPVWMARVKEVVDYVIDEDMYCILNVHHDTGDASTAWLRADRTVYNNVRERYCTLWKQIADIFGSYGQKLLFESFNEMLDAAGTWNSSTGEAHEVINLYNDDFVATVRATGGNNARRNLILNTYCAGTQPVTLNAFRLPEDTVEGHLLAEVHSYAPFLFAFDVESGAKTVFDASCEADVRQQIKNVYDCLVSRGIPCVLGEYGCTSGRAESEMAKQASCYIQAALQYDIPCFYWMVLSDGADRSVPKWTKPVLKDAIIQAYNTYKR